MLSLAREPFSLHGSEVRGGWQRAFVTVEILGLLPSTAAFVAALFPGFVVLATTGRALAAGDGGAMVPFLFFALLVFGGAAGLGALWTVLIRRWRRQAPAPRRGVLLAAAAFGIAANVGWLTFGPTAPDLLTVWIFWAPLAIGVPNLVVFLARERP